MSSRHQARIIYVKSLRLGDMRYGYAFAQADAKEDRFDGTFKKMKELYKFADDGGFEIRLFDTLVRS